MKQIKHILLASSLLASVSYASSFEYESIYKDQRTMGMGGASVAHGGSVVSLFSNPAGLSKIPKEYGWEIGIIGYNMEASHNFKTFSDDLSDVEGTDAQKNVEILKILEDHLGENFHLGFTVPFLSVATTMDKYAFGLMPLVGLNLDLIPHRGSGIDGLLEANGMGYGGVAFGASRNIDDLIPLSRYFKDINVGVGLKIISYKAFDHALTTSEIVDHDDDLATYLLDDIAKDGTSVAFDFGVQTKVYEDLVLGFSLMNIGSIGDEDAIEIPATANLGASYAWNFDERVFLKRVNLAADYVDMFQSHDDADFIKRTKLGVDVGVVEGKWGSFNVQTGLYQGYPTFGLSFRLMALNLGYTFYTEETGPEKGDREDDRHLLSVSVAW